MTSIVPFISNAVFEPADIKTMSNAYDKAIHPNKIGAIRIDCVKGPLPHVVSTRIARAKQKIKDRHRRSLAGRALVVLAVLKT